MLSTRNLFEITDLNKARLGVAGRAALVGAVGLGIYNKVKGNEEDDNETTSTLKKPDTPVITPNNAISPIKTQSNRSVGTNITKTTEPVTKFNKDTVNTEKKTGTQQTQSNRFVDRTKYNNVPVSKPNYWKTLNNSAQKDIGNDIASPIPSNSKDTSKNLKDIMKSKVWKK